MSVGLKQVGDAIDFKIVSPSLHGSYWSHDCFKPLSNPITRSSSPVSTSEYRK